jgi:peptidoglycan/LPS O-acetylase OafA/YrhL
MAYYLAFPFIMILFEKSGPAIASVGLCVVCVFVRLAAGHFTKAFDEPSFLTLKLPVFLAGTLTAIAYRKPKPWRYLALGLVLIPAPVGHLGAIKDVAVRLTLTMAFYAVIYLSANTDRQSLTVKTLASKPLRWLGDCSYGVYLIHLLILTPVAAFVDVHVANPALRWTLASLICAAVAYPAAYALYRLWERPWHRLGRRISFLPARGASRLAPVGASGNEPTS